MQLLVFLSPSRVLTLFGAIMPPEIASLPYLPLISITPQNLPAPADPLCLTGT